MMWIAPSLFFLVGALLVSNCRRFTDDAAGCWAGAFCIFIALIMAAMRFATPACYDGSLIGEALIRACS